MRRFAKAKTRVMGVSRDSVASREIRKEKLPFELLADEEEKLCALFDVIKEKNLYGRKYMGVERSTFLIDSKACCGEWRKVKVRGMRPKC